MLPSKDRNADRNARKALAGWGGLFAWNIVSFAKKVVGSVPGQGACERQSIDVSLSLSLPLALLSL